MTHIQLKLFHKKASCWFFWYSYSKKYKSVIKKKGKIAQRQLKMGGAQQETGHDAYSPFLFVNSCVSALTHSGRHSWAKNLYLSTPTERIPPIYHTGSWLILSLSNWDLTWWSHPARVLKHCPDLTSWFSSQAYLLPAKILYCFFVFHMYVFSDTFHWRYKRYDEYMSEKRRDQGKIIWIMSISG